MKFVTDGINNSVSFLNSLKSTNLNIIQRKKIIFFSVHSSVLILEVKDHDFRAVLAKAVSDQRIRPFDRSFTTFAFASLRNRPFEITEPNLTLQPVLP